MLRPGGPHPTGATEPVLPLNVGVVAVVTEVDVVGVVAERINKCGGVGHDKDLGGT